jgi:hypothetical protein
MSTSYWNKQHTTQWIIGIPGQNKNPANNATFVDAATVPLTSSSGGFSQSNATTPISNAISALIAPTDSTALDGSRCHQLKRVSSADIPPKKTTWLWPGFFSENDVHVVVGFSGMGKTTLLMTMAATVSTGRILPDGHQCPQGGVLILASENNYSRKIIPKLIALKANRHLIWVLRDVDTGKGTVSFNLATGFGLIKDYIDLFKKETGSKVRMIIFDLPAFVKNGQKNTESHVDMDRLVRFAERENIAIVGTVVPTNGWSSRSFHARTNGSAEINTQAGIILAVDKIPSANAHIPDQRVLWVVKSNVGDSDIGVGFNLETVQIESEDSGEEIAVSIAHFDDTARTGNLNDIVTEAKCAKTHASPKNEDADDFKPSTKLQEAENFLLDTLSHGNLMLQKEIEGLARSKGISGITLKRASKNLALDKKQRGYPKQWYWSIHSESHDISDNKNQSN